MNVKYSGIIKTMWFLGMYTPLLPLINIPGFIGIFLSYWMEKVKKIN